MSLAYVISLRYPIASVYVAVGPSGHASGRYRIASECYIYTDLKIRI